jgi:AraC-like DNA-binding protein
MHSEAGGDRVGAIAVLLSDRATRDRIVEQLNSFASITLSCDSAMALQALLRSRPIELAVIEAVTPLGVCQHPLFVALASSYPEIVLIAAFRDFAKERQFLVPIVRAGAHDVIELGSDRIADVVGSLRVAGDVEHVSRSILRTLTPRVTPQARRVVRIALEAAPCAMSVAQFVIATGVNKSTLARLTAAAGLGTPARLINGTRVLVAAHVLSKTHRSVRAVADQLRFASPKAMAKQFNKILRVRPSDFLHGGNLRDACDAFLSIPHPDISDANRRRALRG